MRNDNVPYTCPACGSSSFIHEGTANFKEEVTISMSGKRIVLEGGSPELDIIDSTIKCSQCGAKVE